MKDKLDDPIDLEEKDWQDARATSITLIRGALLQLEMAENSFKVANEHLRGIWENLDDDERKKRFDAL